MKKLSFLSQKGGVCKTSLAALTSILFKKNGWKVLCADMDVSQKSLVEFAIRREEQGIEPSIEAKSFDDVSQALNHVDYDLIIFDGAPHATIQTVEIGTISDLIVLPTSTSIMDLSVQVKLAHELRLHNEKILFIISKAPKNQSEIDDAKSYIKQAGYRFVDQPIFDRTAYRRAFMQGKIHTEVPHKTLVQDSEQAIQSIANEITK